MEEATQPFPYLKIAGIVLASLCATSIVFFVWHVVTYGAQVRKHAKENAALRSDIALHEAHSGTSSDPRI